MSHPNRRTFLKSSLAAAASITIAGTKSSGRVLGANDTIHIAVAGLNGRGQSHVEAWTGIQGVEITYLIDPDTRTYDKRLKQISDRGAKKPQVIKDVRQALTYVSTGNVDAALVYETEASLARGIRVVAIAPQGSHEPILYPMAAVKTQRCPAAALRFMQFLTDPRSEAVFLKYGFIPVRRKPR